MGWTSGEVIFANSNTEIFLSPTTWTMPCRFSFCTSLIPFATPSANRYVPNLSVNALGCGHFSFATKFVLKIRYSGNFLTSYSPKSFVKA